MLDNNGKTGYEHYINSLIDALKRQRKDTKKILTTKQNKWFLFRFENCTNTHKMSQTTHYSAKQKCFVIYSYNYFDCFCRI